MGGGASFTLGFGGQRGQAKRGRWRVESEERKTNYEL